MKQEFYNLKINTNGQRLYEFTDQTLNWIKKNNFKNGILNLSIQHTSASIIVQENADPDVQTDLINYFDKLVPMNNKLYIRETNVLKAINGIAAVFSQTKVETNCFLAGGLYG